MVTKEDIQRIEQEAVERYSERFDEDGVTPTALGWDTEDNQVTRFEAFLDAYNFHDKHVLDVGCGFGDFASFLEDSDAEPASYTGWDITEDFLDVARKRHPEHSFERRNVALDPPTGPVADVAVMMGVLNYRLDEVSNLKYARTVIERAWEAVDDALLVDMLSRYRTPDYPREDFVYYYDPGQVMEIASELSRDLFVKHDYLAIPQKEFILGIRRPST